MLCGHPHLSRGLCFPDLRRVTGAAEATRAPVSQERTPTERTHRSCIPHALTAQHPHHRSASSHPTADGGRCSLKNGKSIFHSWTMFLILLLPPEGLNAIRTALKGSAQPSPPPPYPQGRALPVASQGTQAIMWHTDTHTPRAAQLSGLKASGKGLSSQERLPSTRQGA